MKGSGTCILTTQFAAAEHRIDCNGVDSPSDITSLATWSSGDTTVCTVNSNTSPGLVTAIAGGSTSITATFTDTTFPLAPSCFCSPVQRVSHSGSSTPKVQVPTSLSLSIGPEVTYNGTNMIECNGTNDGPRWGYSRCGTFTLQDQNGGIITGGSFSASETVTTVSSNPSGLTAQTGGGTLIKGTFQDFWAFVAKSSPPPQPGQFVKARQNITITNTASGVMYSNIRINCLDFEYNDVSVTDITKSGTCQ